MVGKNTRSQLRSLLLQDGDSDGIVDPSRIDLDRMLQSPGHGKDRVVDKRRAARPERLPHQREEGICNGFCASHRVIPEALLNELGLEVLRIEGADEGSGLVGKRQHGPKGTLGGSRGAEVLDGGSGKVLPEIKGA